MMSALEHPGAVGVEVEPAQALDFSSLYTRWFSTVYRWSRSLGGPSADTEDLVQEVFIIVQRKLPGFDGVNLGGWLYQITRRTVRDHRRRSWFRHVLLGRPEAGGERSADLGASSATLLEQKQARTRFYVLVSRMSARWRDTFVLFEVVGHSGEEIAALTGLPHATVRTHLARARKEFLGLLAADAAQGGAR